jgi:hypothetical protein
MSRIAAVFFSGPKVVTNFEIDVSWIIFVGECHNEVRFLIDEIGVAVPVRTCGLVGGGQPNAKKC